MQVLKVRLEQQVVACDTLVHAVELLLDAQMAGSAGNCKYYNIEEGERTRKAHQNP